MLDELKFNGARVIVTGAGSGIGQACCEVLGELGARPILVDRVERGLYETGNLLAQENVQYESYVVDVSDERQVEDLRVKVLAGGGPVKALINNAGTNYVKRITELETEKWNELVAVNLTSMFYMCRAFLPMLVDAPKGGSVVNIASTFGVIGFAEMPVYCATKGGVLALSRQLAIDYGPQGVRVNGFCPGPTLSPRVKGYWDSGAVDGEAVKRQTVLGRMAQCREMANAIVFLASDAASYVTGATAVADGGQTIQ